MKMVDEVDERRSAVTTVAAMEDDETFMKMAEGGDERRRTAVENDETFMRMANEGNERRAAAAVDLNLYPGLPQIPNLRSNVAFGYVLPPPPPLFPIVDLVDPYGPPHPPSHALFVHENFVVEQMGGNLIYPGEHYINLEFPFPVLPLQSVLVFPHPPVSYGWSPPEVGNGTSSQVPYTPQGSASDLIQSDRSSQAWNREDGRFRSPFPSRDGNVSLVAAPSESSGNGNATGDGIGSDGLEGREEERTGKTTDFDCNICCDVAKDPVVTPCGHLFCWKCLYQWLHRCSDRKECPVCEAQVIEATIIPIYGRGLAEDAAEVVKSGDSNVESDWGIPPRPRGRRFESPMQQTQRPMPGRPTEWPPDVLFRPMEGQGLLSVNDEVEALPDPTMIHVPGVGRPDVGVSNPPGHDLDEAVRADGHWNHHPPQFLGDASSLRAPWLVATDLNVLFTAPSRDISPPHPSSAFQLHHHWNPQLPWPPADPQNLNLLWRPLQSEDQTSASSTMAVIQGDYHVGGAADVSVEPNRPGSSSSARSVRSGGNASGLFEADGSPQVKKRRL